MLILGEMKSILLHSRGRDLTFAAVVSLLPKVSLMRSLTRLINEKCKLYPVQGFAHQRGLTSLLMSAAMVDTCHLCRKTTPHYKEYNFFHSLLISLHTHSLTEQHFFQKMLNCADLGSYINAARTRLKLTAKNIFILNQRSNLKPWKGPSEQERMATASFTVNEMALT